MVSSHPLLAPLPLTGASSSSMSEKYFIHAPMEAFHPHSALANASRAVAATAGVGLLVSAMQNSIGTKNPGGVMGIVRRTGGTIAFFTAMGFSYSFTKAVTANVRESDGALNSAAGGCAAGFVAGLRAKSLPMAVGTCMFMGTFIGAFEAGGSPLAGSNQALLTPEEKLAQRAKFFRQKKPVPVEVEAASLI